MLTFFKRFRGLFTFILLALIVTVISGTVYTAVQQNYRTGANDPQIEAAETISSLLNQGATADQIVGQSGSVDIQNSLSLFIIIFDKDGKMLASSAKLNGSSPTPPSGVFDYLKKNNEDRFTWQPEKGVRIATVAKQADNDKGIVLVGRSMREVEARIKSLTIIVGIAWVILLILSGLLTCILMLEGGDTIIQETEIINMPVSSEEDSIL